MHSSKPHNLDPSILHNWFCFEGENCFLGQPVYMYNMSQLRKLCGWWRKASVSSVPFRSDKFWICTSQTKNSETVYLVSPDYKTVWHENDKHTAFYSPLQWNGKIWAFEAGNSFWAFLGHICHSNDWLLCFSSLSVTSKIWGFFRTILELCSQKATKIF